MISAIIGHLVGDYLLQNDWMAMNKKTSSFHCSVHCATWTVCVLLALFIANEPWPAWTALPLFLSHYAQDRTRIINWYMDTMGQKSFAQPPMGPWSVIVVDNVFHILAIWLLWIVVR